MTITLILAIAVMLFWTAPGDDGNIGRAAEYDIRVHSEQITDDNWGDATQFPHPNIPKGPGMTESIEIETDGGVYYIAIKTVDDAGNWSGLSNVVRIGCDSTDVMRFDLNCSGVVDISDLMMMIEYMWPQGE